MKKMLLILIAMILITSVTACSSQARNGDEVQAPNKSQTANQPKGDEPTKTPGGKKTDEVKSSGGKKTIVFSTFFHAEFFKEAKKKYEAKHPNITIDLKYIESEDGEQGKAASEKFIKTTNTAMLSGKGPDLIEMDLLPVDKYVNKQLLANMSEMIDADPSFKKEQYFTNILDHSKLNGGLYGMPLNFFMYGLIGNETLIEKSGLKFDDKHWNWTEYIDVVKALMKVGDQNNSKYGLFASPDSMVISMVTDQYSTYVDEVNRKAKFDSDTFIQLLKQVKSLSDQHIITLDNVQSLFMNVSIVSPTDYIREINQSEFLPKGYQYKAKLYAKPHADDLQAGGYFRSYKTIGINAKSSVKEEAWDFIKFMMSDEMQSSLGSAGFPINKSVYQKQLKQLQQVGHVKSDQEMGPMKGKLFKVTAEDVQGLEDFLTGAIYPVAFKPSKVEEIILDESKAYFSGQKSAEAVAKLIQNRVATFLNE
ncbi:ABC transporter substrate-binding protein [Paenibacillus baekrokdamisoli]|uniref:ABC transporter substrate-binding protein n=1 Tax=Paenibacillus baekrokdamisoli TaxID=1712516 RepID=A0A3G9ILF2_9BACL|nr:extracellular solute-binding protein [Paenibacillus baekrokdamisoli]MBB3067647.1 multiple sugar transport system substrate-binding protein [Paenibacillus baekrokdamisoli]BBH19166.1 ABC transporter substrate-binding protein [Paenibacillus baekrokdamisoli]